MESIYFNFSTYLSFVRLGNKDASKEVVGLLFAPFFFSPVRPVIVARDLRTMSSYNTVGLFFTLFFLSLRHQESTARSLFKRPARFLLLSSSSSSSSQKRTRNTYIYRVPITALFGLPRRWDLMPWPHQDKTRKTSKRKKKEKEIEKLWRKSRRFLVPKFRWIIF